MSEWMDWTTLHAHIDGCTRCGLADTRHHTVPGEGYRQASLMFIGEGPGAEEDAQGRPFVGAAGQLLDRMIAAMGYRREQVYIANVVKCRPPNNRQPTQQESEACLPYLRNQVALVRPAVIVLLGATAGKYVLGPQLRITRDRGVWVQRGQYWIMPTFHPAALLREPDRKRDVWEDLKLVMERLKAIGG